jgi:hypothetical protein
MESTAFFETKLSLTPRELNEIKLSSIEDLLLKKAITKLESKCSEHGFVLPGSIRILSRSMGYFEAARFTGEAVYYVKLQGRVVYPADGVVVVGDVIRKNKMGLYVNYKDAIRIQVPRDLHLNEQEKAIAYDAVEVGDQIRVTLKRSKFAIHDTYILASGLFEEKVGDEKVGALGIQAHDANPMTEELEEKQEGGYESDEGVVEGGGSSSSSSSDSSSSSSSSSSDSDSSSESDDE